MFYNPRVYLDAVNLDEVIKNVQEHNILMQFTGLKDKNGKEIYEGDIVRDSENIIRIIKWENGSFWGIEGLVGHLALLIDKEMYEPEIIGNIYETQELLQQPTPVLDNEDK